MAARPRGPARKGWPANLYAKDRNGLYYFWRHPTTKAEFGLGRDFKEAKIQALEANMKLSGLLGVRRLAQRLDAEGKGTVSEFIPILKEELATRKLADNTVKNNNWRLGAIEAAIGNMVLDHVTTKDLHDKIVEPRLKEGKHRAALSIVSMLNDMWAVAETKGWTKNRPAEVLRVNVEVKRSRLSLDEFVKILDAAMALPDRWIYNMMRLALVSAQPRECLCGWEFRDVKDGFLWNERGKTGARIKLPLSLVVPQFGWSLDECIKACRGDVLSKSLLHHNRPTAWAKPGDAIFIDTLTKGFSRARDAANLKWEKSPPSLHEIRSLALRLYRDERGRDFAQALAGHKQGSTTDIYTDVRGSEWIEVRA